MAPTAESQVRDFARQFPTANVRRMLWLCESGQVAWADAYAIAQKALSAGLAAVK